jgi:hypothetical protein
MEGLPDGEARDRAVFEMSSWLAEKGERDMARSWAETIRGADYKNRAERMLAGKE